MFDWIRRKNKKHRPGIIPGDHESEGIVVKPVDLKPGTDADVSFTISAEEGKPIKRRVSYSPSGDRLKQRRQNMRSKFKTVVRIDRVLPDKTKEHYKSITIDCHPLSVWKALRQGAFNVLKMDLEKLRARRKRKGGR